MPGADHRLAASSVGAMAPPFHPPCVLASRRRHPGISGATFLGDPLVGLLDEQVVLVTGATDGLGRGVAADLAARGATVLLHGRSDERLARTVADLRAATG